MKKKIAVIFILFVIILTSISSLVYGCELTYSSAQVPVYKLDDLLICCIEKGAPIRGGSLPVGLTTSKTHRTEANPLTGKIDSNITDGAVWNTPTYKCTSEEELDEVTSYILTTGVLEKGDYDALQYAIWCNHNSIGGINRGNKVTTTNYDYTNIEAYKQAANICSEIDQRKDQILPALEKSKKEYEDYIGKLNNNLNDVNSKLTDSKYASVKEKLESQKADIENKINQANNELNQINQKYDEEVKIENDLREKARVLIANAKEQVETVKNNGGKIFEEAIAYKNFHDQMNQLGGYKVKDTTDHSGLKVIADQKEKKYIVGPYSIDYLKGYTTSALTGERVNFGGIDKLYLLDQDNNKIDDVKIIMDDNGDSEYAYPNPNQQFYLSFNYEKYASAKSVKLDAEFKYIEKCTGKYHVFEGEGDIVSWVLKSEVDGYDNSEYTYWETEKTGSYKSQTLMGITPNSETVDVTKNLVPGVSVDESGKVVVDINACGYNAVRVINGKKLSDDNPNTPDDYLDLSMSLGGYVFLDTASGKIQEGNNYKDDKDMPLSGMVVTLYNADGTIADLAQEDKIKPGLSEKDKQIRTNPTITDENGYYEFNGIDSRNKYYVGITYNGQTMTNTGYLLNKYGSVNDMVNAGLYNNSKNGTTDEWMNSSKGTETDGERNDVNNRYKEIGSYPDCYTSTNSLGYGIGQNKVYQHDKLTEIYSAIEGKTRNYILNNKAYPNVQKDIYNEVIRDFSNDSEIKNKLQYIEDTKLNMYTGSKGKDKLDLYPVYDAFVIDSSKINIPNDKEYPPIYPGQFFVNFGLKYRATLDLALYKDVYKSTVQINGKSEDYYYDKRAALGKAFSFGVNIADINGMSDNQINGLLEEKHLSNISESINNGNKFNYRENKDEGQYTQFVRREELNQDGNGQSSSARYSLDEKDKLGIYLHYKIAIKNQSSTIGKVTELVDYFDSNFGVANAYIGDNAGNNINAGDLAINANSKYGENSQINPPAGYNKMYIEIPDNDKTRLADGEALYVYVTLKMNNPTALLTSNGNNLLDNQTYSSFNYVEINGYKSYYSKNGESTPGLIDIDSVAGNFNLNNYEPKKTELEDDEDLAPVVIFTAYENRQLSGTVFEDSITSIKDASSTIKTNVERAGDGKYGDGDTNINGVKVELLEIKDGKLQLRAYTTTDKDGNYQFDSYIPGDYVIKFVYGSDDNTALTTQNENFKGLNERSYNGQDYHSTIRFDNGNVAQTVKDESGKDVVLTSSSNNGYWYSDNSMRASDATDLASRRNEVIAYSKELVNYRAEVLDSYKEKQVDRKLVDELEDYTNMSAYTHVMNVEIENSKVAHTYDGNQKAENYIYKIPNVDFGISERSRNTLKTTKDVTDLKLVGSDNQVLAEGHVDNNGKVQIVAGNVKWLPNSINKNGEGKVYVDMDTELLHGAKLEVTYNITVKNQSESDTYNGNQVRTKVLGLVDYLSNNYTFDTSLNSQWSLVSKDDLQKDDNYSRLVNKSIDLSTLQNMVIANESNNLVKADLAPNEEVSDKIVLTKLISDTDDETDQLYFDNSVEILKTTNTVGRDDFRGNVGNFNPIDVDNNTTKNLKATTNATTEPDSAIAERVAIIPPTGSNESVVPYIVTLITSIGIIGTLFIVMKNIKKNKIKLLNK